MTISLEEHVARAIAHLTKGRTWEHELSVARAAIAAMREREGAARAVLLINEYWDADQHADAHGTIVALHNLFNPVRDETSGGAE